MEERHNNAVEKVEEIMNKNKPQTPSKKENKSSSKKKKIIKEQSMAKARVEKAREKELKKAEKQKHKMALERDRNKLLAEKLEKKEMAKQEKRDRKESLKQEKLNLKRERMQHKKAHKEARLKNRQKNKEQGRNFGGWLTAVISLGVITLALSGTLTYFLITPSPSSGMLESSYRKSFYETVEQVDNIDLNLSKILATSDKATMQKYLVDTAINSELCESQLQQLPIQDESKFYTTKLINQIGDYSKYLNNKVARGEELSEEDLSNLFALYEANKNFKKSLQRITESMGEDFNFSSLNEDIENNYFLENLNELENLSVEYPELIYDGPFSDGVDRLEIKGLNGSDITSETANQIYKEIFSDYNPQEIKSAGITEGDIKCFNVEGMVKEDGLYAQISVKGGKLIMFAYSGSCLSVEIDREYATEKALEFLSDQGIKNMKAVWINLSNNVYTINFAPEENGVIIYSDLIKIRVCAQTAMVIGLEATEYYTNHTERIISSPKLSKEQAMQKVSSNIEIKTSRLALVPIGQKSERLCYEFSGEYDGSTFYVYIDAIDGRQVELFKVIKSGEGELLM